MSWLGTMEHKHAVPWTLAKTTAFNEALRQIAEAKAIAAAKARRESQG